MECLTSFASRWQSATPLLEMLTSHDDLHEVAAQLVDAQVCLENGELDALNDKQRALPATRWWTRRPSSALPAARKCPNRRRRPPRNRRRKRPQRSIARNAALLRQDNARFCAVCGQSFEAESPKPEVEITWPEAGTEEPPAEATQEGDEP